MRQTAIQSKRIVYGLLMIKINLLV